MGVSTAWKNESEIGPAIGKTDISTYPTPPILVLKTQKKKPFVSAIFLLATFFALPFH